MVWTLPSLVQKGAAMACITVERSHTSGYQMHPAVADANLHLSAAAQRGGGPQAVLRVPAAVGYLFLAPISTGRAFPVAWQGPIMPDGSVVCRYKLPTADGKSGPAIGDLVAKEMLQRVEPRAALQAARAEEFLYQTEWQASQSVAKTGRSSSTPGLRVALRSSPSGFIQLPEVSGQVTVLAGRRSGSPSDVVR